MDLLDAVAALALTLAGLATIATIVIIILETCYRVFGIRRPVSARIMKQLVSRVETAPPKPG